MDMDKLKQILEIFENSKISSMDLEVEDMKLKLEKNVTAVQKNVDSYVQQEMVYNEVEEVHEDKPSRTLNSPLVGTFYASSRPNEAPFVQVGTRVAKGDVVCIVEAMKSMNEIKAEQDGVILEILVKDGDMVEYDQAMFVLGE